MTLLSIVIVLLVEQVRALPVQRVVLDPVARLAGFLEEKFNDGGRSHGAVAWGLGVALPAALVSLLHGLLMYFQPLLAFLLGIGVLYLTMGFRQFSHFFTNIHLALRQGEFDQARQLLAQWRHRAGDRLTSGDIARLAIEEALLSAHRHVFAEFGEFGQFAHQAFALIDWVPIRVTAASFAVVGDFEDAVHCWRTQAVRWPEAGSGILLASGAGALGVRLGMPVHEAIQEMDESADRPELVSRLWRSCRPPGTGVGRRCRPRFHAEHDRPGLAQSRAWSGSAGPDLGFRMGRRVVI